MQAFWKGDFDHQKKLKQQFNVCDCVDYTIKINTS